MVIGRNSCVPQVASDKVECSKTLRPSIIALKNILKNFCADTPNIEEVLIMF